MLLLSNKLEINSFSRIWDEGDGTNQGAMESTFMKFWIERSSLKSRGEKFSRVIMVIVVVGVSDDHHLMSGVRGDG